MRLKTWGFGVLTLFAFSCVLTQIAHGESITKEERRGHLLIHVIKRGEEFIVSETIFVPSRLPKRRGKSRIYAWRYSVIHESGRVLFKGGIDDPTKLRGEFIDPDDPSRIDSAHIDIDDQISFSIRTPLVDGSRVDFFALKPKQKRDATASANKYEKIGSVSFPKIEIKQ